ncbi:hypothetical protein R3P38DRAFT_3374410 [Favolaschia claudopus]|uniref:C3H1-type domain-containing protein n=1 Tax=Favolaschia claudopus TaxID=2862362 RepID=A0AAV9ZN83_9AGAR
MTDGVPPPPEFQAEDVAALQEMVKKYVDGDLSRVHVIASLSAHLVNACGKLDTPYKPELLIPYLEQLDAHDATQKPDEGPGGSGAAGGGGNGGSGDPPGGEDDEGGELGGRPKRRAGDGDYGDEERSERKNARVDTSQYAWRSEAQQFLDSFAITPEHREVLRRIGIYSQDVKEAKLGNKQRKGTAEICCNYNNNRCKAGANCHYRHACSECNTAGHPALDCPDKQRRTA